MAAADDVGGHARRARRAARALAGRRARGHAALAEWRDGSRAPPASKSSPICSGASSDRGRRGAAPRRLALARHRASSSRRSSASRSRRCTGTSAARSASPTCSRCCSSSPSCSQHADRCRGRTAIVLGFFAAFVLVYLLGYFNLETKQALDQFTKGMVKFVLHFLFLAAGVTYLARRGRAYYWRTLGWFTARARGELRLRRAAAALRPRRGTTSTTTVLSPLTGGASSINVYGSVDGASVYRPNALTGDPNHLGIMLDVPLLALTPVYLRLERGHRLKWPLALALALHAARAARDAVAQRCARPRSSGCSCSRCRTGGSSGRARCSRRSPVSALRAGVRPLLALALLLGRAPLARRRRAARRARRTSPSTTSSRRCSTRTRCSASG